MIKILFRKGGLTVRVCEACKYDLTNVNKHIYISFKKKGKEYVFKKRCNSEEFKSVSETIARNDFIDLRDWTRVHPDQLEHVLELNERGLLDANK